MKKLILSLVILFSCHSAHAATVQGDADSNGALDVAKGGTNATTAADARTSLGVPATASTLVGDCTVGPCLDGSTDGGNLIKLWAGTGSYWTALQGGAPAANRSWRLPIDAPPSAGETNVMTMDEYGQMAFLDKPSTSGYVLSSTDAGVLSWIANGSGGSMVYPGAGLAVSTGSAWGTSITMGTGVATALAAAVDGTGGLASYSALQALPVITWGTGLTDNSSTISVTYPVTAEAYGSGWDADGNGATKNDVYDAGFEQKASNETITGTRTFQGATAVGDGGDDIDIVYDSTPGSDDSWSGAQMTITAGENLAQWDIVYAKNASGALKWYKYDANGTDKLLAPRAVALAAITADATGLAGIGDGIARNDGWAMTTNQDEGKDVWASGTAGALTLTKLSTSGDEVARLGYVLEENVIQFSLGNVTLVEVP